MKRIIDQPDQNTIIRLARLETNNDAQALYKLLKASSDKLNKLWKDVPKEEFEKYQGAGKVLDEVIELFEESSTWVENIKK